MSETTILGKFEWNNHKAMPKEKLLREYLQLSPEDKAIVWEYLTPKRSKVLENALDEYHHQQDQVKLERVLKIISMVFDFFIDTHEIKRIDEAALLATLLIDHSYDTFNMEKGSHYSEELLKFEQHQEKILEWINKFIERNQASPSNLRGPMLENTKQMVSELEYVPIDETFPDFINKRRKLYIYVFKNGGMGASRAEKITKGIIKFIEWLHNQEYSPATKNPTVEEIKNICLDSSGDCEQKILNLAKRSKNSLSIDEDNDNFSSAQIKEYAMNILLPDYFLERGKVLYKVNCPVEDYPFSLDLRLFDIDDYLKQEAKLFESFGKSITNEHIEHIREAHRTLQELPKSEEELKESHKAYTNLYPLPF